MSNLALIFLTVSTQFNLPQGLMSAVCYVESQHDAKAMHIDDGSGNSMGLCQLQPNTARMLGFVGPDELLFDPATNAYWAASYLRHQVDRYHGDYNMAISAYNAGHFSYSNLDYVLKVLTAWRDNK